MLRYAALLLCATIAASCAADTDSDLTCSTCKIEMRVVARIGDHDGPGSIPGRPWVVLQDQQRRYWVAGGDFGFPLLYDSTGRFLQQVGRKGRGPGEFEHPILLTTIPGDSVLLRDMHHLHVITPDLRVGRSILADAQLGSIRIAQWPIAVLARAGYTGRRDARIGRDISADVSIYDMSGVQTRVKQRVMYVPSGKTPKESAKVFRTIGDVHDGQIWIANAGRYLLVSYALDGSGAQDSIERQLDWFPPEDVVRFGSSKVPPHAHVQAVEADERGRLWVYTHRPVRNYRDAWEDLPPGRGNEMSVANLPQGRSLWRTVLEIIDPATRGVIARRELDEYVFTTLSHDRVATYRETDDGIPTVTIIELTLRE